MRRASFMFAAIAALSLALAPGLADARAGGGRSFGSRGGMTWSAPPSTSTAPYGAQPMQRSFTPGASSPGYSYGAPAYGYGTRSGFTAGLMGGLIGAGLAGLLLELCGKVGDGVNQAAGLISATASIPSLNFIPLTTFGNWF
jgi:predicted lipid-binding transport protein (Tim44 family)